MAGSTIGQQLVALLKKNFLLKKRNVNATFQEIFFPVYFVVILGIISLTTPRTRPEVASFPRYSLNDTSAALTNTVIYGSPHTPEVEQLLDSILESLSHVENISLKVFATSQAAEEAYIQAVNASGFNGNIIGLNFKVINLTVYDYTLRFPHALGIPADPESLYGSSGNCREQGSECPAGSYFSTGFSNLQLVIDTAIIKNVSGLPGFAVPQVSVQQFPKVAWTPDVSYLQNFASIYLVLAYSFFVSFLTVQLVWEKERKIKEGMRIMGLKDSAFWLSWFITYVVVILVVTTLVTLLSLAIGLFKNSNLFIFFLLLFLYGLSIINVAFMLTPFFNKAEVAGAVASLSTILFSLLYFAVSMTRTEYGPDGPESSVPAWGQWLLALFSPVAFALGIDQGMYLDFAAGGMEFSNINVGQFPLRASLTMLAVDIMLYGLLAVYFDNVVPSEYGQRRSPLFCFMPSYWNPNGKASASKRNAVSPPASPEHEIASEDLEPVDPELAGKNVLRIKNIKKAFKGKKGKKVVAVDGISLDIYEGQITALLGHNGAGKTTLINMLTGLSPPTAGTASLYGLDVSDASDMGLIRGMTGVCPQHNILFDKLNCEEHLEMYGALKGVSNDVMKEQVTKALSDVDILDKRECRSEKLSGGQKRKLCVAIALIGDPKVIFLDEPTAGMDPYSRRKLWRLLKDNRPGRVIVLTTHFMDEADILADRKAFISRGKIKCVGSSLFLKNKFGVGYHLSLVMENNDTSEKVTDLVQTHVAEAKPSRSHGRELTYTLPLASVASFPALFAGVESAINEGFLGIGSFGVSMTSLEEVFLKIGVEEEVDDDVHAYAALTVGNGADDSNVTLVTNQHRLDNDSQIQNVNDIQESVLPKGESSTWLQIQALVRVRFLMLLRRKSAVFFRIGLPIIFMIAGAALYSQVGPRLSGIEPLELPLRPDYYVQMTSHPNKNPDMVYLLNTTDVAAGSLISNISSQGISLKQFTHQDELLTAYPHHLGVQIFQLDEFSNSLNGNITALYNDTATHSLPVTLNVLANALMGMATGAGTGAAGPVIMAGTQNWPNVDLSLDSFNTQVFGATILIGMALVTLPASLAVFVVRERQEKARSQLRISGVTLNMYWGTVFLVDYIQYLTVAVFTIIVVVAFRIPSLMFTGAIVSLVLLFLVYMPVNMLFAYLMSFGFQKYDVAQAVLPNVFWVMALLGYGPVSSLDMIGMYDIANILHYVFTVIDPPYVVFAGVYYIDRLYFRSSIEQGVFPPVISTSAYFQWDSNIPICLLMPVIHAFWMYFFLRYLEVRQSRGDPWDILGCRCGSGQTKIPAFNVPATNPDIPEVEDEDVRAERDKVEAIRKRMEEGGATADAPSDDERPHVVVARGLRKEFPASGGNKACSCGKKSSAKATVKVAVRNVSFSVRAGEVFGLLGPNGAGKTTTLNVVIAEEGPTLGRVAIAGHDIGSNLSEAFHDMGYCPQHDALWELVTTREHLECYAAIKGVRRDRTAAVAEFLMKSLFISEHADKVARKLSGGTKRKLSYAMSMLGDPKVVLMDEPSTGMDPRSKRFLWDTISSSFVNSNRGAILTTHYMEEADALCDRVAIMVNGQLQCLGSSQHLKNKYGSGYILEIKLSDSHATRLDALRQFVLQLFATAEEVEAFGERITFRVPQDGVGALSETFNELQTHKQELAIEDYSFSQSTLEQVFLGFAKKQHDAELEDSKGDHVTVGDASPSTMVSTCGDPV